MVTILKCYEFKIFVKTWIKSRGKAKKAIHHCHHHCSERIGYGISFIVAAVQICIIPSKCSDKVILFINRNTRPNWREREDESESSAFNKPVFYPFYTHFLWYMLLLSELWIWSSFKNVKSTLLHIKISKIHLLSSRWGTYSLTFAEWLTVRAVCAA